MKVSTLPGIGAGREKTLKGMGINTVADLLRYFPRDYDDRSDVRLISELELNISQTVRGTIASAGEAVTLRPGMSIVKFMLQDESGTLELVWFGQPYLKQQFKKGDSYFFTGRVSRRARLQMESPEYVKELPPAGIVPLYTLPKGVSQKMFRKWMRAAIDAGVSENANETLPAVVAEGFCTRQEAVSNIHFPESEERFHAARRRLVFEELFFVQLALMRLKGAVQPGEKVTGVGLQPFLDRLPYSLTAAQESVLRDICADLQSGKRMNRLVQGDVGSGKTAVAAAAAYLVTEAGFQAAVMAPTEVLARQHMKQFSEYLPNTRAMFLAGSLTAAERREAHRAIREGGARLIVGTHALIQEAVEYERLALVITDEQHRFGVNQRAAFSDKGSLSNLPHTLIMTATPIPRTLGLILYGDMDISTIDTLPPGRQEIKTYCVDSSYQPRLWAFMEKQAAEGRQVYVICPAVEESPDIHSVTDYAERLQTALPNIPVACMHGRMKDKDAVMAAFSQGEYKILVSTTVIEVGVDVPNATLMVIENAERFGLSQLHQLRGRVGRGKHQSFCVLVTDSKAEHTKERMRAMEESGDGFVLSELDLKLRGPGDFFGVQQHGLPGFRIANLYRDMDILKEAQKAALAVYEGVEISAEERRLVDETLVRIL